MKNSTSTLLFELLKRCLAPNRHYQPGEPSAKLGQPSQKTWLSIITLAERNEVSGLLYDAVITLPKEQQPDFEVLMQWTAGVQSLERDNRLYRQRLSEVFDSFDQQKFVPTLMKGLTIAELYPQPLHRSVGDVDLFVPIDKQQEVADCLTELGGKVDNQYDVKHASAQCRGLNWELHFRTLHFYSPITDKRYSLLEQEETIPDNLFHETIEGHTVQVFSPMFNIIYLTAHFQHHLLMERISLRQVVDWILVLNQNRAALAITENRLIHTLKQLGLHRTYKALGYIAIQHLRYSDSGYAGLTRLSSADRIRGRLLLRTLVTGHVPGCKPFDPWQPSDDWLKRMGHYFELCKRCFVLFNLCPREAFATPFGFIWQAVKRRQSSKKE